MPYAYRYDFHNMKEGEHEWWRTAIGNTDAPNAGDYECGICGKQVTTKKNRPNRMGCKGCEGEEE